MSDSIDVNIRSFIWGKPHTHWVDWNSVTQPKSLGGLGLRKTHDIKVTLLGKQVWSLLHDDDKLWTKFLSDKYRHGANILQMQNLKWVMNSWNLIIKVKNVLNKGFIYRIGCGDISFWYDK